MTPKEAPKPPQDPKRKIKKAPDPRRPWGIIFWILLFFFIAYLIRFGDGTTEDIIQQNTLRTLEDDLRTQQVKYVILKPGEIVWRLGDGAVIDKDKAVSKEKRAPLMSEQIPDDLRKLINEKTEKGLIEKPLGMWTIFLLNYAPWLLLLGMLYFMFFRQLRSGGPGNIFSFGKSRATLVRPENINKTFKDVAGVDEAKEELTEVVEFLKDPQRFTSLGGRLPRGILLYGPPGTGKTLLAKAIAGEAGVPFYTISGSDFVEMFVGVGASRVRDLFHQAKENSPAIIFLDEIDAVGRRRGSGLGGGHDEREQTLNAILVEMDGFESDEGVIVIASTNRVDVLDPALLRPGRFDRHVTVTLPDIEGRKAILKVHAQKIKLIAAANIDAIAQGTPGFSGADLENLLNESALIAVTRGKTAVDDADLESARDKVAFGKERKSRVIHQDDLKITAYHESGHALVSLNIPESTPLHKLTIIPRGDYLGAAFYLPQRDETHRKKSFLLGQVSISYGGRVAEELFFHDITTGAANDIKQASDIVRKMVTEWGMSEKLGMLNFSAAEERMFLGGEITRSKNYSEETAKIIDEEVGNIQRECYARAKKIVEENRDALVRIAEHLMRYETLMGSEVIDLAEGKEIQRKPPSKTIIKTGQEQSQSVALPPGGDSGTQPETGPTVDARV